MRTGYIVTLYIVAALTILAMPEINRLDSSALDIAGAEATPQISTEAAHENSVPNDRENIPASSETVSPSDESDLLNPTVLLYRHETDETVEIPLDDYVLGVVAAEMPVSFGEEALKAQAIAARTYVLYRLEAGYTHGESEAAVCDSYACCAAYISPLEAAKRWGDENALKIISEISLAVSDTKGLIVSYGENIALTVWHSRSYGQTKSSEEVWGGYEPYLVPVSTLESKSDVYGGHGVGMSQYGAAEMAGRGCTYDEILSHYYPGTAVRYIE